MALSSAIRSTTGMAFGFSVPLTIWIGVSPSSVVCSISHATLAKVHQDLIDRQTVQPGREGRLAAKAANFSKELDENLLCEVFGLRNIPRHPQAEGINPPVVALVKLLEGNHVALRGLLCQGVISCWRCPGFGCGHVFVCSGKRQKRVVATLSNACSLRIHDSAYFKGAATYSSATPRGLVRGAGRPQRGCDAAL